MASSTITSKGQMTIPKPIRDRFRLRAGDRVDFVVEDNRIVMIPAKLHIRDIVGLLPSPSRAFTIEEMDDAIQEAVAEKYRRKR